MTIDTEQLAEIFERWQENEGHVAILLHKTPDPDAVGSAAGLKLLLEKKFGLKARLFHYGEISHPQNKSMKNVLHISMDKGDELNLEETIGVCLVDSDLANTLFTEKNDLSKADVRFDHHSTGKDDVQYEDVRPVGACCSIIWEYINEFGVELDEDVATALVLGIETDTLHFTSATTTELDYEAYRHLLPFIDRVAMAKINRFTLPKVQFEKEKIALENLSIQGSIATTFVGELNDHNRDLIATVADRFSRMETVSTVVVMGIVANHLIASVRSEDVRHDVASLVEKAFGKDFSGAKEGSGGARVPLGIGFGLLSGDARDQALSGLFKGFTVKILEALGEE